MSGEAIKIAVRVRPFTDKEKGENQICCIEMVSSSFQPLIRDSRTKNQ
jgi:hypothetical protein